MRCTLLLLLSSLAGAQSTALLRLDPINLIPPAVNPDGTVVAFAAAMAPDGTPRKGTDLYIFDRELKRVTNYSGDINLAGITSVTWAAGFAGFTAQPAGPDGVEEVHLFDVARGADRTLVSEKVNCAQILLCLNCSRSCLGPVHVAPDGSKVLYSAAVNQPFRVLNADGSGRRELPIYSGVLAPSPQRVISRSAQLVFSSSAPSGPTFAAAATDVHTVNLDGTGLRQVTHFGSAAFFAVNVTSSAEGAILAFESNYQETSPRTGNQIWVVRSDGTELRRISTGSEPASSPSISADGSIVVFVQGGQIKRAKTSGDAAIVTLTRFSVSAPRDPVVSDDGSSVVFTLGPQNGSAAALYRISGDSVTPVYEPRFVNINGVVGAAGHDAPSPGSLISLFGANLGADEILQASSFPLPDSLNGVSLAVNGRKVPLIAATRWQINAQLPQSVGVGTAAFQVSSLAPVNAEIKSTSPAILSFPFNRGNAGYSQAAAFHAGTGVAADMDHPAAAGEVLEVYGMGLGLTDPSPDGGLPSPASPPARALRIPRVQIGTREATVLFAGLTPGLAGVYQVNIVVPSGLAPGLHTLTWLGPDGPRESASIAVK